MNLNDLRDRAYKCACDHGFHDNQFPDDHWLMLVVTELSEMVEANRKNMHADVDTYKQIAANCNETFSTGLFERYIKDSVEDEMADVVIRLLDYAGLTDIDLRPLIEDDLHDFCKIIEDDGNKHITSFTFCLTTVLTIPDSLSNRVMTTILSMYAFAKLKNVDLQWHIEQKMQYNALRPHMNGKCF